MAVKINYKGEELTFDTVPSSAQLEAAYETRKGASRSLIQVCRPWPLRRDESPTDHGHPLGKDLVVWTPGAPEMSLKIPGASEMFELSDAALDQPIDGIVINAVEARSEGGLAAIVTGLERAIASIRPCGRVVVLARQVRDAMGAEQASLFQALESVVRSASIALAASGGTANLVTLARGAEDAYWPPVRFLLSDRSSYITGQALHIAQTAPAVTDAPITSLFNGKVALVTGGTSGIGRAISQMFVREGATALCVGRPGSEALAEMSAEPKRVGLGVNLTDEDAPQRLVEAARAQGGIDLLVHSAGISSGSPMADMTLEQWRAPIAINLDAPLKITQALFEAGQLNPGARVVYISSVAGLAGSPSYSSYASSKSGVIGAMRAQARLLGQKGLVVNAAAPGIIETRMFFDAMSAPVRDIASRMNVLGQVGQASDIANAVSFLCDESTRGINGTVLRVCGGYFAGA